MANGCGNNGNGDRLWFSWAPKSHFQTLQLMGLQSWTQLNNWTATWSQGHSVHSNFSCLTTASEAKGQHESCYRRVSELLYYSGTPSEELCNICSQGPLSSWTPRGSCPLARADFSGKLANLNLQDPLRSSSYCCICDYIAFTSERIPRWHELQTPSEPDPPPSRAPFFSRRQDSFSLFLGHLFFPKCSNARFLGPECAHPLFVTLTIIFCTSKPCSPGG